MTMQENSHKISAAQLFCILLLMRISSEKVYPSRGGFGGTGLAVALRFVSHVLSGVFVFASAGKLWDGFETSNSWLYSIVYNGCYMLPELILTCIGAVVIYGALFKALKMKV